MEGILHIKDVYYNDCNVMSKGFVLIHTSATNCYTYLKLSTDMSSTSFVSHFGVTTKVVNDKDKPFMSKNTKKYYIKSSFGEVTLMVRLP